MRSLPSVENAQTYEAELELTLTTPVGSAYIFKDNDIQSIGSLRSRMRMGGGLGLPSNYTIELHWPLDEQKMILRDLPFSETKLKVTVNSDTIYPHFGRVVSPKRDTKNPDLLKLDVTDALFYNSPQLPVNSIVDSWANPHNAEVDADAGFPLYYGDEAKRDIYFTAVDSIIHGFIGPENVSSGARERPLFHNQEITETRSEAGNFLGLGYLWNQQSGSDNLATDIFSEWLTRSTPEGFIPKHSTLISTSDGLFGLLGRNNPGLNDIPSWNAFLSPGITGFKNAVIPDLDDVTSDWIDIWDIIYTGSFYQLTGLVRTDAIGSYKYRLAVGCSANPYEFTEWESIGQSNETLTAHFRDHGKIHNKFGDYILSSFQGQTQPAIRVSTDAINYDVHSLDASSSRFGGARDIHSDPDTEISHVIRDFWGEIYVSTDYVNWPEMSNPNSVHLGYIIKGNSEWLGIGDVGPFTGSAISVSSNGFDWTEIYETASREYFKRAVYTGSFYIVSGKIGLNVSAPTVGVSCTGYSDWEFQSLTEQVSEFLGAERLALNTEGTVAALTSTSLFQTGPLFLHDYEKNSVFTGKSPTEQIAISENPVAILDHIFSHHLNFPFVQDQSSTAQSCVDNYKFNAYFGARELAKDVIDEFGETCGVGLWVGDSGMMNFRTYAESGQATVDGTLTEADMANFEIQDNPIGSPYTGEGLFSRFRFAYKYDFQRQEYTSASVVNPSNNSMCSSLSLSGVNEDKNYRSRYLVTSEGGHVAWPQNRTRIEARPSTIMNFDLPASWIGLELGDVVKVQQRMIVGSETLGQVVDLRVDYKRGKVKAKIEELKAYEA